MRSGSSRLDTRARSTRRNRVEPLAVNCQRVFDLAKIVFNGLHSGVTANITVARNLSWFLLRGSVFGGDLPWENDIQVPL